MTNQNNRIYDFFKNNVLSEKAVIRLLIAMICVLLIYIAGMRFIDYTKNSYLSINEITTEALLQENESSTSESDSSVKVNINTDNIYELCTLTGIGKAKAQQIIDYRKENGNFSDVNELRNVSGIGDKIFEGIKDNIYIGK